MAIYVAYEMREDAVELATVVRAVPTTAGRAWRWNTQAEFWFDRAEDRLTSPTSRIKPEADTARTALVRSAG